MCMVIMYDAAKSCKMLGLEIVKITGAATYGKAWKCVQLLLSQDADMTVSRWFEP